MNEITRIHLARVSYDIDIAAKKELEKYLKAVAASLGSGTDAMEDVEVRMTEILAARGVLKDNVITEGDVEAIEQQLGTPNDFSDDENTSKQSNNHRAYGPAKRYYRDLDNAMIGGVLSGLAAFTGWDVTLLRIIAVVLVFIGWGSPILVYLIVWLVSPAAESLSEKMEMRGEPINIESIKQSAQQMGERAEEIGKDVSAKAKKLGEEAKKTGRDISVKAQAAGKKLEVEAPRVGTTLGRALLAFFGVLGLVISVALLCALLVVGNLGLMWAATAEVAFRPLLIVALSFVFALVLLFFLVGLVISLAFIAGGFTKGYRRTLAILASLFVVFAIASAALSVSWTFSVGREGVRHAVEQLNDSNEWWGGGSIDININRENTPVITGVTPDHGPLGGGTQITITGRNFTPNSNVFVGGQLCLSTHIDVSAQRITCTTQAYDGYDADIEAGNPARTSVAVWVTDATTGDSSSDSFEFTYVGGDQAPTPTLPGEPLTYAR
jgi:phage shock protein PspC (stress-responsive transcriptional regulator)